jgi:hypothetical protein
MRIVRGHPVVILGGLLLTLAAAAFLVSRVQPEYEAKASVALLPAQSSEPAAIEPNPLENPNRVAVWANALVDVMQSSQFAQRFAERGAGASYEVSVSPTGGGALLALRTSGPSAASAFDGMNVLIEELGTELDAVQTRFGVREGARVRDSVLTAADEATPVTGSKTRVLAITLALGVIATYGLAVLADTVYGERKPIRDRLAKRREKRTAAKEVGVAPSDAAVRLEATADDENDLPSRPADDHREGDAESGAA